MLFHTEVDNNLVKFITWPKVKWLIENNSLLKADLYDYLIDQSISPALRKAIQDFGFLCIFYRLRDNKTLYCCSGVFSVMAEILGLRCTFKTESRIINNTKKRAVNFTQEVTSEDIERVIKYAEKLKTFCTRISELTQDPLTRRIDKIMCVERDIAILCRDAILHPWSEVGLQFSLGDGKTLPFIEQPQEEE